MKYFKLLLIAVCCILAFWGVRQIRSLVHEDEKEVSSVETRYEQLKNEIDQRCCASDLNVENFDSMLRKIRKSADSKTIKSFQEQDLNKHLYTLSCDSLLAQALTMFSTEPFTPSSYSRLSSLLSRLNDIPKQEKTVSLKSASTLFSEYNTLVRMLNYSTKADYEAQKDDGQRFVSFEQKNNPVSPDERVRRIKAMKYYADCFSRNDYVTGMMGAIASRKSRAQTDYYDNLVSKIADYYRGCQGAEFKHNFSNDVSTLYLMNSLASRKLNSYSYLFD